MMNEMLIKVIFGISLLLLVIAAVLFYINLGDISNFFIVRFDVISGINFLGGRMEVGAVLATGFGIILINFLLARAFLKRDKFLAHLLPFFTLFLSLLILIAVGVIIATN